MVPELDLGSKQGLGHHYGPSTAYTTGTGIYTNKLYKH